MHAPHRPPRHPRAWLPLLLLSQAVVAWLWWRWGWPVGLPVMLATHAVAWWGVLAPNAALYGPVLSRLSADERQVWLTIDDGPSDDTLPILDLLDAHGARATFFLVGDRAQARPDLVREIASRGHGIANHSLTHPQARFWALGPRRMRAEIEGCQRQLQAITGAAPRWFRAVVGHANPFVSTPLRDAGLARVGWNARGFDAVERDVGRVVSRIEHDLAPGAIVLLHEGAPHGRSVEMIAAVLARLEALGYRAVVPEPGTA
ncbi:polysaccharide deacetylase family protein [Luteimonas kalidii]|uniref:Polysaccharide deacetylase family protein n=1 Tax=Luteimonas kalidii TaxID=3042025 RepID=A0ABT6JWL1_9GAMM|nr:polysaccharide deacetylase family protein [Luteimonas kalidii]MDH5835072.1 polysaccharide deacetylase family protein [Luteimonas kalidii]